MKLKITLFLLLFSFSLKAQFDGPSKEKAVYIYGFAKNFEWPQTPDQKDFKIGFISEDFRLLKELETLSKTKTIGPFKIKVVPLKETDDLKDLNILYSDLQNNISSEGLLSKINKAPVLLVTYNNADFENSMVNFVEEDGKLKFSLNTNVLKKHKLNYSVGIEKMSTTKIITTAKEWNDVYSKFKKMILDQKGKIEVSGAEMKQVLKDHDDQNKLIITQIKELDAQKEKINAQLQNLKNLSEKTALIEEKYKVLNKEAELKQSSINEKQKAIEQLNNFIKEKEAEIERKERSSLTFLQQTKIMIDEQEKNIALQKAEINGQKNKIDEQQFVLKTQKSILYSAGAVILIITILAFISFRNYRQKQKANALLALQNTEISEQKQLLEEKQKEIIDSIHYAKRIQRAILPTEKYIERNLSK